MEKETKNLQFEVKEFKEDGTFTGMAAVYGNVDLGGDVIEPGAFTRTLKDRGGETKLLWQHNTQLPIGKGKLTSSPAGLHIEGKLALGISAAKDAYEAIKAGIVDGLSIGYDTIREEMKGGVRHLNELRLHEVSLVTFPMNELARVSAVKSEEQKAAERKETEDWVYLSAVIRSLTRELKAKGKQR
jgi:HK97 family phage prohead protease